MFIVTESGLMLINIVDKKNPEYVTTYSMEDKLKNFILVRNNMVMIGISENYIIVYKITKTSLEKKYQFS